MNSKQQTLTVIIFVVFLLVCSVAVTEAQQLPELHWFTFELYEVNGDTRLAVDFYSDEEQTDYLGSISIAYDCDTIDDYYLDEVADVASDDYYTAMVGFYQSVWYTNNSDPEDNVMAWDSYFPETFQDGETYDNFNDMVQSLNQCQPEETYTVFLPMFSK